jgi:predicted anti-sigma-YlaC factor YlaD
MRKFFIPCEEANHVCDKNQYKEASFLDKIKLTMHLAYCTACRKYSSNNAKLTAFLNKRQTVTLSLDKKQILKQQIKNQLNNQ